jgi:hypothetical protein
MIQISFKPTVVIRYGVLVVTVLSAFIVRAQQWTGNSNATDVIWRTGRVGIGTSSPENPLHIDAGTGGSSFKLGNTNTGRTAMWVSVDGTGGKTVMQSWLSGSGGSVLSLNPSGGKVGVGTDAPQAQLDVFSREVLGGGQGNYVLLNRFYSTSGATGNYFLNNTWLYRDANGNDWMTARLHNGISIDASYGIPGTNTRTWWERSPFQDVQSFGTDNKAYLTIKAGNIGIGTAAPQAQLDVFSRAELGSAQGNYVLLNRFYSASGASGNYFNNNTWLYRDAAGSDWTTTRIHNGISIDDSYNVPGANSRTWWERSPFKDIQSFGNGSTAYLTIKAGNVGIGTINPDTKLNVKGVIHTEEVRVDLNVPAPDYVFAETYELPTLQQIESYIKQNKHLPEVPSGKEMEENGMNLKEMNLILLKKVEELTLYMIELKKENEEIKKQLKNK